MTKSPGQYGLDIEKKHSLRVRLLFVLVSLVFLTALLISAISTISFYKSGRQQILDRLQSIVELKEGEISTWVDNVQAELDYALGEGKRLVPVKQLFLTENKKMFSRIQTNLRIELYRTLTLLRWTEELSLVSPEGIVLISTNPAVESEFRGMQPYFTEGMAGSSGVFVQNLSYSPAPGGVNNIIAVRTIEHNDRVLGIFYAKASLDQLNEIMRTPTGLGETGKTYLVGSNRILLTSVGSTFFAPGASYIITTAVNNAIENASVGSLLTTNHEDIEVVTAYRWYDRLKIVLIAEQGQAEAFAPILRVIRISIAVLIIACIIAGIVAIYLSNSLIAPLRLLVDVTREIQSGNFDSRVQIATQDEIGQLSRSINEMQDEILKQIESVKKSEEQFRTLVETIPDLVWLKDVHGTYLACNKKFELFFGAPTQDIIGKNDYDFVDKKLADHFRQYDLAAMKSNDSIVNEEEITFASDGHKELLETVKTPLHDPNGTTIGVLSIARDITERRIMEQQLRQSQKLEAIGTLASGIAHDFNNMLGGIIGAAEMLTMFLQDKEKAEKYIRVILYSADRAAGLTKQLLTFSRNSPTIVTPTDIHKTIKETILLAKNAIDKRIELKTSLNAEKSIVAGDPSQLQNVFLNLCVNSAHAMPNGGRIDLSSQILELDGIYCKLSPFDIEPGQYLEMELRDTGTGISPQDLPMIFDPFFTTKRQGEGTGLGLSSVYQIIRKHKGAINVYSELGKGTTFHILLPLTSEIAKPVTETPILKKGSGKILVVDDEEVMRATAKAVLENLGYQVILAKNGQEAIEVFQQTEQIDLVLLDMIMPVMNGRDCFYRLREIDSQVRVVLSSGFTKEEDLTEMQVNGLKGFIRKPYRSANLSKVIFEALD